MRNESLKIVENINIINNLIKENEEFFKKLIGEPFKTKYDYYVGNVSETEYEVEILFYDEDIRTLYVKYSHPYFEGTSISISENILLTMIINN